MKLLGKIVLAVFVALLAGVGLVFWSASGNAPYVVAALVSGGNDHEARCAERALSEFWSDCDVLGPQRVFEGIYFDEFEGQQFLDGARPGRSYVQNGPRIWLTFDSQSVPERLGLGTPFTRVWHVRFLGRKTIRPGQYGHFGMSCYEIVVDRVLWARPQQASWGYLSGKLIQETGDPWLQCPASRSSEPLELDAS